MNLSSAGVYGFGSLQRFRSDETRNLGECRGLKTASPPPPYQSLLIFPNFTFGIFSFLGLTFSVSQGNGE